MPDSTPDSSSDSIPDTAVTTTDAADIAVAGAATGSVAAADSPASTSTVDWRELQGRFVDDPQAAVKEAGALVEQALSDLRASSESGSTEDLRTAFRRYRDLHAGLS